MPTFVTIFFISASFYFNLLYFLSASLSCVGKFGDGGGEKGALMGDIKGAISGVGLGFYGVDYFVFKLDYFWCLK